MANTKNTIQNIPLTGPLCLNKLKTDVTQFEGYNEKNTTVFGGELTPLWENEEEIESTDFSYTVYNSKGHKFTVGPNEGSGQGGMHLYGPNGEITDRLDDGYLVPFTTELDLPIDAVWGGMFVRNAYDVVEVYLSEDLKLYQRGVQARYYRPDEPTYVLNDFQNEINKQPWTLLSEMDYPDYTLVDAKVVGGYNGNIGDGKLVLYLDLLLSRDDHFTNAFQYRVFNNSSFGPDAFQEDTDKTYFVTTHYGEITKNPNFIMSVDEQDANNRTIYITYTGNSDNGRSDSTIPVKTEVIKFDADGWHHYETGYEYDFNVMNIAPIDDGVFFKGRQTTLEHPQGRLTTYSFSPYSLRQLSFSGMDKTGPASVNVATSVFSASADYTGHDDDGYLPNLAESDTPSLCSFNFICRDNYLTALTFGGVHITAPTTISNEYVTISKPFDIGHGICVNYKSGNSWYCFMALSASAIRLFSKYGNAGTDLYGGSDLMKNLVIDNRYILMLNTFTEKTFIYDIEEEGILYDGRSLGYVDTKIPVAFRSSETTGAIWGGGFNAGFEKNNARFVGYMENPYVIKDFPKNELGWLALGYDTRTKYIQSYFSMGDTVQSAAYNGSDPTYFGTFYPIDPNGNSILPYTLNSKIINGYSNNDMIRINNIAYPLMYYNTNQKIYAYQQLSFMNDVEGIFSLQGQQYTFDENNIYNVTFQNGIISNAQPICYKKNLTFLGTLPTAAIFYSFYNKTFYQFTGDAIVSKMFEANDINEIYSVAQNPSTLSLWICTDQGVYVMSDTDMFKLNYVSREPVFFQPESSYIVENYHSHRIAFYKQNDEAEQVPIKLATKYYGLGSELKANLDCWYIRLHNAGHKNGKLKLKVNTITNTSFETEEKTFDINKNMYDVNNQVYIRYQPKYQTAVAMQLELESDIAIYQISLGVNATDAVSQQSKFNF